MNVTSDSRQRAAPQRTLYAEALPYEGKKHEVRKLVTRWPLPVRDNSPLRSSMYPRFLALKKEAEVD